MNNFFTKVLDAINPNENSDLNKGSQKWEQQLPTIWLLGKTGAGKSSIIEALTNNSSVEIGNGFSPCTTSSKHYDYPADEPILRFLDTRGLSEINYNPSEDIELCQKSSHALIVVMKVDEVEQSDVLDALRKIKKIGGIEHLLVVHSNILSISTKDRAKAIEYNQHQFEEAWGEKIDFVSVDFSSDSKVGVAELIQAITKVLPFLNIMIDDEKHTSSEEYNFNKLRKEIIWYAGSAGASDLLPAVGLVSVPAIQGKMLHSLANQYGVEWNKQTFMEFIGLLGTGFAIKYSAKFAIRELVKFVPIYGQTVGSATAGVISSASTYAIGRVACKYLYHKSKGEQVSTKEMTKLYAEALTKGTKVAKNEANKK
jgi:uncharacterized protein (DUF697 family)/GTP-binding protein EngB required for normal cell division